MRDLISRQAAIDAVHKNYDGILDFRSDGETVAQSFEDILTALPSAQPEQTKMIKEIREWINSGNRGKADYFIVDKIEEILKKYER